LINDYFFYKLGRISVGDKATEIGMILYIFNHTFSQQMHRLFSSSYEAMLGTISLYFFMQLKAKFDFNMIMVIALQSFSFVIRNTSPIAWVVLLLLKAYELGFIKMMKYYIIGFFIIFLPIFLSSIAADSWFYKKLTIVPLNFI